MHSKSYVSVAFRSLPREFKEVIAEQKHNDLEALLTKPKYSYATKIAAQYYFEQQASQMQTPASS